MSKHDPDWFSLAAGILFTTLGLVFAVAAANSWSPDGRWITATSLIVLGIGGIAASLTATRRQQALIEGTVDDVA